VTTRGPNPIDDAEVYSVIVLAGVTSPGHVTLSGAALKNRWEEKAGDGQDGDTSTLKGRANAHFTCTFELWDEPSRGIDHFAGWDAFLPMLHASTAVEPLAALDIYHPDLARLKIGAVQVEEIGQLKHDGIGGATVELKLLEFRPPKPKSGTPGGSKSNGSAGAGAAGGAQGGQAPDPNADAKAEVDALVEEAKAP